MRWFYSPIIFFIVSCTHSPHAIVKKNLIQSDETPQEVLAETLREEARASYQRLDYLKCNQLFEAANLIDDSTTETRFLNLQFYAQLSLGLYDKALQTARTITKANPYQATSYQQMGLAQLWGGDKDAAGRSFRRGLEFDSHSPKLHFYYGLVQEMNQKNEARDRAFATAEKEYLQILSKNSKDFVTNYDLAALYLYWNKNLDEAEKHLKIAKQMGPESESDVVPEGNIFANFYFPVLEGVLYLRRGGLAQAKQTFLSALQNAQPGAKAELAEVNYYLGLVTTALEDKISSKGFFDQSILFDPHGPYALPSESKLREFASAPKI